MSKPIPSRDGRISRQRPWDGAEVSRAFAEAAPSRPWTIGYRSLDMDKITGQAAMKGRIPEGLRGTLYRNGPARHERGGQRYAHRWDGDGMVQQFEFTEHGVTHFGRFVQTEKYAIEAEQGRFLVSAFGTHVPGSSPPTESADPANVANISMVHHGGELLALWEAGSAYRIDPSTLTTLGPKTWDAALLGRPFSAHPRLDPDGSLWNFGADPLRDELTIYHVGRDGGLLRSLSLIIPGLPPIHDFGLTERHLVFLLPSIAFSRERLEAGSSFAEACQWSPASGMKVLTIDKTDWSQRSFELPPGCLFHVANAWQTAPGLIKVLYLRSAEPISLLSGWSVMRGEYRHHEGARLTSLTLDLNAGTTSQDTIGELEAEFPSIDGSDMGVRNSKVLLLERSRNRGRGVPGFDQVGLLDTESGHTQRFLYGDDWLAEEHLLIRGPDDSRSRWIIGAALDLRAGQTAVSVFDARRLEDGPVAQAKLPYSLPLGLHGTFVPAS